MSEAKLSVSTKRGNSRTGNASKTSMKAFVRRWIVSQRRSSFRSLTTGTTHSSTKPTRLSTFPRGKPKPAATRRARVTRLAMSMRLKVLCRKTRRAGFTTKRVETSAMNISSKHISSTAAWVPRRGCPSTVCARGSATDARIRHCMKLPYQSPARLESGSSKNRNTFTKPAPSLRPWVECALSVVPKDLIDMRADFLAPLRARTPRRSCPSSLDAVVGLPSRRKDVSEAYRPRSAKDSGEELIDELLPRLGLWGCSPCFSLHCDKRTISLSFGNLTTGTSFPMLPEQALLASSPLPSSLLELSSRPRLCGALLPRRRSFSAWSTPFCAERRSYSSVRHLTRS
mmetsp:Transcript_84207/g.238921  ORF Transcript_84207/g.238921 Transcript_84207/m.238921 type:complete len:342 (-) Transcript_84207:186-1211(-)